MGNPRTRQSLRLVEPKPVNGKPPPHNLDAEAVTLSSMFLEPSTVPLVLAILHDGDFYSGPHTLMFRAFRAVFESGQDVDATTITEYLRERGQIKDVGGVEYIAQIIDKTPSVANVAAHAKIVAKLARRRREIALAQTIAAEGYDDVPEDWESTIVSRFEEIARPPADDTRATMREALAASRVLLDRMAVQQGGILGVATPCAELNALLGGLHEHEVTLVGGRRGSGKTAFMCQTAIDCARSATWEPWTGDTCQLASARMQGISATNPPERIAVQNGSLIFSQEMPKADLALRMRFSYGRVDMRKLRTGAMGSNDWGRSVASEAALAELPIEIDDQPSLRLVQLRARVHRVREEMATRGIRLRFVGLDYVQIMDVSDMATHEANATRERQLANLGERLVALKKQPDNHFIAWMFLVQINADGSARESKALEQAADNMLEIRVEQSPNGRGADDPTAPRRTKIAVTKQRNGPSDHVCETWFHGAYVLFNDSDYIREELPE